MKALRRFGRIPTGIGGNATLRARPFNPFAGSTAAGYPSAMTFPPLVERELRVASRQRVTYRLRVTAAVVAVVVGSAFTALTLAGAGPIGSASLGRGLFSALTWMALPVALLAGPFLTSDSLSQERRDGTLGLLFLTPLRGFDIVLGKLVSTSLRAGYAMLAILPVLAITLMMGGTTGGQFWRTVLALGTALEVSLAVGLLSSALNREPQRALGLTLVLLAALILGGPAADALLQSGPGNTPLGRLTSPGYLFLIAPAWGKVPFWTALLLNQLIVGILLALATALVGGTWREQGREGRRGSFWRRDSSTTRSAKVPSAAERRRMERNPVFWLSCRETWVSRGLWVAAAVLTAGFVGVVANGGMDPNAPWASAWFLWGYVWGAFSFLLFLATASQAVRLHADARRSGLLELLLTTPLSDQRLVEGQWLGLVRMIGRPLLLCLLLEAAGTFLSHQITQRQMATLATMPVPAAVTNAFPTSPAFGTNAVAPAPPAGVPGTNGRIVVSGFTGVAAAPQWTVPLITVLSSLTFGANLVAIAWTGLWFGLTSRSGNLALLKTLSFVQVIPAMVIFFLTGLALPIIVFSTGSGGTTGDSSSRFQFLVTWMPVMLTGFTSILTLVKDIVFIQWARRHLAGEFRTRAADSLEAHAQPAPPLIPQAPPLAPA